MYTASLYILLVEMHIFATPCCHKERSRYLAILFFVLLVKLNCLYLSLNLYIYGMVEILALAPVTYMSSIKLMQNCSMACT